MLIGSGGQGSSCLVPVSYTLHWCTKYLYVIKKIEKSDCLGVSLFPHSNQHSHCFLQRRRSLSCLLLKTSEDVPIYTACADDPFGTWQRSRSWFRDWLWNRRLCNRWGICPGPFCTGRLTILFGTATAHRPPSLYRMIFLALMKRTGGHIGLTSMMVCSRAATKGQIADMWLRGIYLSERRGKRGYNMM